MLMIILLLLLTQVTGSDYTQIQCHSFVFSDYEPALVDKQQGTNIYIHIWTLHTINSFQSVVYSFIVRIHINYN